MDRKIKIKQSFSKKTASYHLTEIPQKQISEKLSSFLPSLKQADILEIGCGTGFLTHHLISKYPDSTLCISDISEEMLSFTKNHSLYHNAIDFKIIDGEAPAKTLSKQYDLIVTSMTVQWFADPKHALQELRSFLKPNGLLLYASLGPNSFPEWRQTLQALSLQSGLLKIDPLAGEFLSQTLIIRHNSALEFFQSLKKQGALTPNPSYKPLKPGTFLKAICFLDKHYSAQVSWVISYGSLTAL